MQVVYAMLYYEGVFSSEVTWMAWGTRNETKVCRVSSTLGQEVAISGYDEGGRQ